MRTHSLSFVDSSKTWPVLEGTTLLEAIRKAGFTLPSPCGGQAICGKCKVRVVRGAPPPAAEECEHLSRKELEDGYRLACLTKVTADIRVDAKALSSQNEIRILSQGSQKRVHLDPAVEKIHVQTSKPTASDSQADIDRVLQALRAPRACATPEVLRRLPNILRQNDFQVTVAKKGDRILAIEAGDTVAQKLGIAVDIGTTTVVAFLMDLATGHELAVRAASNPQRSFGDDVISRVDRCKNPQDQDEMHQLIVSCLADMCRGFAKESGLSEKHMYETVVTGNTAMSHLFLNVSPAPLAMAPYVPVFRDAMDAVPKEIGLTGLEKGSLYVMPGIAGFVGGDIVAGILFGGMHKEDKIQLLIDIGTNGEIALGSKNELLCCSTAAGPAFEGARIRHGMRAEPGAVERARVEDDLILSTIDRKPVRGICGSGLIDLIAELCKAGLLDMTGRFLEPGEIPENMPPSLRSRLVELEDGFGFRLASGKESATGRDILLYPKDIREFQLAKAAIYAGIEILVKEMGLTHDHIDQILLAGAFGNYIHVPSAIQAGLLPSFPQEKIRSIGNSAGAGAKMVLLSKAHRAEAEEISRSARYVELAGRGDFQEVFSEALLFPESGMDNF